MTLNRVKQWGDIISSTDLNSTALADALTTWFSNTEQLSIEYQNSSVPFNHVKVNDVFEKEISVKAYNEILWFAEAHWSEFRQYNAKNEKYKWTYNKVENENFPPLVKQLLAYYNSPEFIQTLENITWIEGLLPDEAFTWGWIHITHGGWILKPHKDFNILPATIESAEPRQRVLNIITYINPHWIPEYKWDLILWKEDTTKNWIEDPTWMLEEIKIQPEFNSALLFDTREAIHGQKEIYQWPQDKPRVSLATYYYIKRKPEEIVPHSTLYYMLPGDTETEAEKIERIERSTIKRYLSGNYENEFNRFKKMNEKNI